MQDPTRQHPTRISRLGRVRTRTLGPERVGGLLRATGRAERLAEAAEGQMAAGADGHRGGVEADGLVGLARAHQRAGEVMVDPEVLRVGPLGAPEQGGRLLLFPRDDPRA